jgi:type III pantothenate kinase
MPALLLDIGNTRTKIAVSNQGALTLISNTKEITKTFLNTLIKKYNVQCLLYSNVSEKDVPYLQSLNNKITIIPLNNQLILPFRNNYKSATLGQDRIALASGATDLLGKSNILIISLGTCITYDIIDARNDYLGGGISPGLYMRFKALHHLTARLPLVSVSRSASLIGRTTEQSMQSGVINGIIGELNYIIREYKKKYKKLNIILTGGDASYFEPHINYKIFAGDHLALRGLQHILKLNYPDFV